MGSGSEMKRAIQAAIQSDRPESLPLFRLAGFANALSGCLCWYVFLALVVVSRLYCSLFNTLFTCDKDTQLGLSRSIHRKKTNALCERSKTAGHV